MATPLETVIALMRTADLARRYMTAIIEPHGITLQQFNVLRILRGAGDEGLPTLDVAQRMVEQTPGVTAAPKIGASICAGSPPRDWRCWRRSMRSRARRTTICCRD